MSSAVRLEPEAWGESALLFTAVGGDADSRWRATLNLHRALGAAVPDGVTDWIHAFESVLVAFDCTETEGAAVVLAVQRLEHAPVPILPPRRFRIPIRFGNDDGPDLADAAHETSMTPAALIEYLASGDLTIGTVGGNAVPLMLRPGQPWTVARMRSPRTRVPAGSLGIAGDRTCIYPVVAPGGWRLVGRTPLALPDRANNPIVAYRAGDVVRLVPVSSAEADALEGVPLVAEIAE